MKKAFWFFLAILLSYLPAAAQEIAGFRNAVADYTSVDIMVIPMNWVELSYTLNNGPSDVLAQKAATLTRNLDQLLQRSTFRAFNREQLFFTPDVGSIARIAQGPELLAYQRGVVPVQQGANRQDDKNRFAIESTEYAVIPAKYTAVERIADSRLEAKRLDGRKSGSPEWMIRMVG